MRYRWEKTHLYDQMTIIMVARNLVTLCYPFIETLISTIPLGCRYLIGNFGPDTTKNYLAQLAQYMPIEVVDLPWLCDEHYGWGAVAIGKATQDIMNKASTEFSLNLQACEVYTDSATSAILAMDKVEQRELKFNHFYGSMKHGGHGYGGYGNAPRLYKSDSKFDKWDAWTSNDYGGFPLLDGFINRYGYCHHNTIKNKIRNHAALYFDGDPEASIPGCISMGYKQTWFEEHPECVRHLIEKENYDADFSIEFVTRHFLKPSAA